MKNIYHRDLLEILSLRGNKGLGLKQIARLVYNRHVGLFVAPLSYRQVYQNVRFYLWAQSKRPASPFRKGMQRGCYALKPNLGNQMELHFDSNPHPHAQDTERKRPDTDGPMLF